MVTTKKRRLAAILFADIVGYTAMMQADEQQARIYLDKFRTILDEKVAQHQGKIINYYGDGCLCVFNSAVEAMHCAKTIQELFLASPTLPVRIGLHSGDVFFEADNVFGDSVNIASRIESLGVPGAILFSKRIEIDIANQTEFQRQSLGNFAFKNVEQPMEVFALTNQGFAIPKRQNMQGKLTTTNNSILNWRVLTALTAVLLTIVAFFWWNNQQSAGFPQVTTPSIAVLPFKDLSPGKDQAYFADGMAEEILNTLAQLDALRVAGRTSSFSFKDKESTIAEIGQTLKVNHVLEGSVQKQGDKIRVTAQLVNVADGYHIWSDKYDRDFADVFAIQDELAQSIGKVLLKKLAPAQLAKLAANVPDQNGPVYALFLKAKHLHKNIYGSSQNIEDFRKSERIFLEAIQMDSTYALAHAGLADLYDSYWVALPEGDIEAKEKYANLMDKESALAVLLSPKLSYVNLVRGYVLSHINQTHKAFEHFVKAYQISPNNPETMIGLANLYLGLGLHQDALYLAEKAVTIDPLFSSGLKMKMYSNYYLGNLPETIKIGQSFLDIDPNNLTVMDFLFRAHFFEGNRKAALTTLERMEQIDLDYMKKMGFELEIALLRADKDFLSIAQQETNPNINFNIHHFNGEAEQAMKAYELVAKAYIANNPAETNPQWSTYLDILGDKRLAKHQDDEWFQKILTLEKTRYDFLFHKYPRAAEILD